MSDRIKSNDIIDDELFVRVTQNGEHFLKTIKDITDGLKENLVASQRIMATTVFSDSAAIEKYTREAEKAAKLKAIILKGDVLAEKVKQESIKTQAAANKETEKSEKAKTKEAKAQKELNSEYKQASIELRNIEQRIKDNSIAGRDASVSGKMLIEYHKELKAKVTAADQSVGDFRRNVGNYKSGFDGLGNSINQLTREFPAFANSVQTGFMAISNNLPIFFDEIKRTQTQIKALRAEGQQVPGLFAQLTTSIFSWGTALSVGVTLLTVYGGELVKFISTLGDADEGFKLSYEAQSKYYKELRDLIEKQLDSQLKLNVAQGKMTQQEADDFRLNYDKKQKLLELENEYQEERRKISEQLSKELTRDNGVSSDRAKVEAQNAKAFENAKRAEAEATERYNKKKVAIEKATQNEIDLNAENARKDRDKKKEDDQKKAHKKEADYQKMLRTLRTENIDDEYVRRKTQLQNELDDNLKQYKDSMAIQIELKIAYYKKLEELDREFRTRDFDQEHKFDQEKTKLSNEGVKAREKDEEEMDKKYSEGIEKLFKKETDAFLKTQKNKKKKFKDMTDEEKEEYFKKLAKDAKEEFQLTLSFVEDLNKAKSDRMEKALNNDIDKRQRNIQQQQQLAAQGLDNTLAYEKEALAKEELARQQLAKKKERDAKILAFLKLISAYADKDDSEAVTKAFVQMAVATAITGSFAKGVEGLDGPGTETSDSILARLSKNESVITAKGTHENPGLPTAMNKGKVDEYFEKEYLPKYLVSHDVGSFAENTVNSLLLQEFIAVKGEMQEMRKELKQRPVSQVSMNNLGEVIDTKIVNGLKKQTTHKNNSPLNYL